MRPNRIVLASTIFFVCFSSSSGSWLSDRTGINIDVNKQVGTGIAAMGAPVAEKFEESGNRLIDRMSAAMNAQLDKADAVALVNEQRSQAIIVASINQVDQDITKQIQNADEVLEKRLGNADVIAAKAELGFEDVVRRLLLLGCILVFLTAMGLRIAGQAKITSKVWMDGLIVGGTLLILYVIYLNTPRGNVQSIVEAHERGYHESLAIFDFREARYHLAQLKVLKPGDKLLLGREKKLELLDLVLDRPATYQTKEGVLGFKRHLAQALYLTPKDPDLAVITSFMAWQTGTERFDEYAAASTCTEALLSHPMPRSADTDDFVLRSLAVHYVKNYVLNPLPQVVVDATYPKTSDLPRKTLDEMYKALADNPSTASPLNPMLPMIQYDESAQTLYRNVTPEYVQMVYDDSLIASLGPAEVARKTALSDERKQLARKIEDAWRQFDVSIVQASAPEVIIWVARANTTSLRRVAEFDGVTDGSRYGPTEHAAFVVAQLANVLPPNEPILGTPNKARQVLDKDLQNANAINDKNADLFEQQFKQIMAVLDKGSNQDKVDATRAAEPAAAALGLFTCGQQFICQDEQARPVSFPDRLEAMLSEKVSVDFRASVTKDDFAKAIQGVSAGQGYHSRGLFLL